MVCRLTIRKEGIWITCLKLNNKTIIFLSSEILSHCIYVSSKQPIFIQNCLVLQQNWLCIKIKNICHQQWQQNNVNLACFIAITKLSFLSNWKWEMLFEKQNIRWKHYINVLKIVQSLRCNRRWLFVLSLLCFYSKVWMCLTC